jgi:uncharacterized protein
MKDQDDSPIPRPYSKGNEGFASMPKDDVRALAQKGGRRAHELGVGHEFEKGSELARTAGRKGGLAAAARKRAAKLQAIALLASEIK